jgi:hypothetical protein
MALQTRKPTGLAPFPVGLLAGKEKTGKSYAIAVASASPLLGRTLWVSIGENDPDEYINVPGSDFEIVVNDGSYRGILQAFKDAVAEPRKDGKPTLLAADSMTRLWNLITENAQQVANRRAKGKRNAASGDYAISMDLWNVAAQQWKDVMDVIRSHDGPVLLTARLEETVVMDEGQPTKDRVWKVQGHKSLAFDVDFVIQMRDRGQYLLTGVRSAKSPLAEPIEWPNWTATDQWLRMGVQSGAVGPRHHSNVVTDSSDAPSDVVQQEIVPAPESSGRDWFEEAKALTSPDQANALWNEIPRGERSTKLQAHIASVIAGAVKPDPAEGWAKPKDESAEWSTDAPSEYDDVPTDDEAEASMALEGMEPPTDEPAGNGGYDR